VLFTLSSFSICPLYVYVPASLILAVDRMVINTYIVKPSGNRFEPWNRLVVRCNGSLFIFLTVCVGKSNFVLLALLIPALGSPLSNRFCRCAGIVLQSGWQVANSD
jgi:hypothetical protein